MYFIDRYDAAMQLGQGLAKYKNEDGLILAIPRGGVPIGYYLAKHLNFELDLLMTKKIGHPSNEEYAIGAVGLDDSIMEDVLDIPEEYLKKETVRIRQELKNSYKKFMGRSEQTDISGKIVIVVDDGIATGRTILAALRILQSKQPRKLIVAVPVASRQAAELIKQEVDEFVCLHMPFPFYGVGRFYRQFTQVDDKEVMALLNELNTRKHAA